MNFLKPTPLLVITALLTIVVLDTVQDMIGIHAFMTLTQRTHEIYHKQILPVAYIGNIAALTERRQVVMREAVMTTSKETMYRIRREMYGIQHTTDSLMAKAKSGVASDLEQEIYKIFTQMLATTHLSNDELIKLKLHGYDAEAQHFYDSVLLKQNQEVSKILNDWTAENIRQAQENTSLNERQGQKATSTVIVTALVVLLVLVWLALFIRQMFLIQKNTELELRRVTALKDEFLGMASHDLKNPLSSIITASQILHDEAGTMPPDEVRDFASMVLHSSATMSHLVTRLLDVNALERGGWQPVIETFDLTELIGTSIAIYTPKAQTKDITIHYEQPLYPMMVAADRAATEQVIDNLVSNAIKYSPRQKNIWLELGANSSAICFSVRDEGPGISDEDQKHLFGTFARLTAQPTGGESSTGLGLSIVKKMVEAMNGKVWCESTLGQGATFLIELPKSTLPVV
jgi:signal transduction histidine kinase